MLRPNPERHELRLELCKTQRRLYELRGLPKWLRERKLEPTPELKELRRLKQSYVRQLRHVAPTLNKNGTPYWPKRHFVRRKHRKQVEFINATMNSESIGQESIRDSKRMLLTRALKVALINSTWLPSSGNGTIRQESIRDSKGVSRTLVPEGDLDIDTILLRDLTPEKIKELLK